MTLAELLEKAKALRAQGLLEPEASEVIVTAENAQREDATLRQNLASYEAETETAFRALDGTARKWATFTAWNDLRVQAHRDLRLLQEGVAFAQECLLMLVARAIHQQHKQQEVRA